MPFTPEVPEVPFTPEVPEVPFTPEVPEVPFPPEAPSKFTIQRPEPVPYLFTTLIVIDPLEGVYAVTSAST